MIIYKYYITNYTLKNMNPILREYINLLTNDGDIEYVFKKNTSCILYGYTNNKDITTLFENRRDMGCFVKEEAYMTKKEYKKYIKKYPYQEIQLYEYNTAKLVDNVYDIDIVKLYTTRFESYISCVEKDSILFKIIENKMNNGFGLSILEYLDPSILTELLDHFVLAGYYYHFLYDEMEEDSYSSNSYSIENIDELKLYLYLFKNIRK